MAEVEIVEVVETGFNQDINKVFTKWWNWNSLFL